MKTNLVVTESESTQLERRQAQRFPVKREVRYRAVKLPSISGGGESINLSSSGILFTTEEPLPAGSVVEMALDWPVRLNGSVPLQLVVQGRVVRRGSNLAAIAIQRSEFRTSGTRPVAQAR